MRALARERQERPLKMRAKHIRTLVHRGTHVAQVRALHVDGVGDQREHLSRGAVHGMSCPGHVDALGTIVEALLPGAMNVDVHVAGGQDATVDVDGGRLVRGAGRGEVIVVGAGGGDPARGVGHDPAMLLHSPGVDSTRVVNGDGRGRHLCDCLFGAGDILLDSSLIPSPPIMPQDRARVDDP